MSKDNKRCAKPQNKNTIPKILEKILNEGAIYHVHVYSVF